MIKEPVVRGGIAVGAPPGEGRQRFSLRTFQSLKNRGYRYYLLSSVAMMACMNMQMMANGWFMYQLSGSAALLGLTALANAVPQLALSFAGGIIADRMPKKGIIILGLLAFAAVAFGIALSTQLQIITWHYLVISSFLQGTVMALMMPARQTMVVDLVGRESLMNAVGLNMVGMNVNRLGAPALAGFLIAGVGVQGVYFLMTGLFLLAVVLIIPVPRMATAASRPWSRRLILRDLVEGADYVRKNRNVVVLLALTLLTVVLSMPYFYLLPVFTEDVLKVGPAQLGLLISISGVGALVGSLAIASLGNKGRGMLFLHASLGTGVILIAFALSSSYVVTLAIMIGLGLAQAGRMALSNTLLQVYTTDAYMGRVMSLLMMEWGISSLGGFSVSVASEFIGVQWAVGITAAMLVVSVLLFYAFSPRLRRLD